jgi:uncharacterized membrane-anchored protein
MTPRVRKGLIVAALHVAIVASLGAKLLVDRATRPRVWARAAPVDPDLPIRGRYVRLRIEAAADSGLAAPDPVGSVAVDLAEEDGRLVARPSARGSTLLATTAVRDGERVLVIMQPLAYFIPEHVPDPSVRATGEELWVEVTLPRRGAPRPIRLGVKKGGVLTPLDVE